MTMSLEFQRSGPKDNSARVQSTCKNCAARLSAYTAEALAKKELSHVCKKKRKDSEQSGSPVFTPGPPESEQSLTRANRNTHGPELKVRIASSSSAEGVCSVCGAYFYVNRTQAEPDRSVLKSRLLDCFEQHARMLHGAR